MSPGLIHGVAPARPLALWRMSLLWPGPLDINLSQILGGADFSPPSLPRDNLIGTAVLLCPQLPHYFLRCMLAVVCNYSRKDGRTDGRTVRRSASSNVTDCLDYVSRWCRLEPLSSPGLLISPPRPAPPALRSSSL